MYLPTLLVCPEENVEKLQSQMHKKTWEEGPLCYAELVLEDLSLPERSYQRMDRYT